MFARNGRWYDGHAQVFIGLSDREALEMGLYPSVTTILNLIHRPALDRWLHTQVAKAAQIVHRSDYPTESEWIRAVEREADAEAFKARQRGLLAHSDLGSLVEQVYPPGSFMITTPAPPRVSTTYRFGGQADGIIEFPNEPPLLVELKTTSRVPPVIYREHILQLGAYCCLYQVNRGVFIILSKDNNVLAQETDSQLIREAMETFLLLTKFWWRYTEIHKPIDLGHEG
ncbi:MAG: hypothetical protein QXD59_02980 [Candidatus Caldarchaeum sp.]